MTTSSDRTVRDAAPAALVRYARKMAHDLNNYAAVMRTYSELLLTELPSGQIRDDVEEVHRAADAMVSYVARVARFARTGSMRAERQLILPLVQKAVEQLGAMPGMSAVEIAGDHQAMAEVDATWMVEVLLELLRNAREASPGSAPVQLVSQVNRTGPVPLVVVEVRDRGPGFAGEIEPHVGEPFVTTKTGVRGAGMGLAIASAFADACGGRLVCSRREPMTVVALELPLVG